MTYRDTIRDRRKIPILSERWGSAYTERSKVRACNHSVIVEREGETKTIPIHNLVSLRMGPGTTLTHEAAKLLADAGVCSQFVGQEGVRHYSTIVPLSTSSRLMERQATLWAHHRNETANVLYEMRYGEDFSKYPTIPSKMGAEGVRVRTAYKEHFGSAWTKRHFDKNGEDFTDMQNYAINQVAQSLNSIVLGAILSFGLSPALGFIHHGDHKSFVWDIKDLYMEKMVIPMAASLYNDAQGDTTFHLERMARKRLETHVRDTGFCDVLAQDLLTVLGCKKEDSCSLS